MSVNIESQLIQNLKEYLQGEQIKVGDRLPSERKMAVILGSSRSSVRNAIKMLQAKGILEVKPSSGYYLKTKAKFEGLQGTNDTSEEKGWITDQLEVFYLFEPQAVILAAVRMSEEEIKELEDCLVNLSKAMLENNALEIVGSHKGFHEIVARGTGNKAIIQMMQRLELTYELVADIFQKITPEDRDEIFALHVNLFNSISGRDKKKAFVLSQEMVLCTSELLNRFEGIDLPDCIKEAMKNTNHID